MFNDSLRKCILKWAKKNPSNHSCEVVQNGVMDEMGFAIKPMLAYCWPFKSGIQQKIRALDESSVYDPGYVMKIGPEEAARLATQNGGTYIILALLSKKIFVMGKMVQKNHVAIVIDGDFSLIDGPACGGGGMTQDNIDKEFVLSNARIHFTDWKSVNYYLYCYKKE